MLSEKVKSIKNKWIWLTIAVIYFFLDRESIFVCDDFRYAFVQFSGEPIKGWHDAIRSQMHAYIYDNGRFLVHTIVQYFAGVLGLGWLRLANQFFFMCLCFFLNRTLAIRNRDKGVLAAEIFVLLLTIPLFGTAYLGNIAMSVNYLWTSALNLAFIYLVECQQIWKKGVNIYISVFLAFIVGAWQESFSIGMCVALFVYILINRKQLKRDTIMLIVAYWIGACFLIFAPSNFAREAGWNHENTSILTRLLQGVGSILVYAKTFNVLVVLLIWQFITNRAKAKLLIRKDIIFLAAAIINVLFIICVAFTGPHQLVCVELFSSIVIMHWIYLTFRDFIIDKNKVINIVATCVMFVYLIPIYIYRIQVNDAYYEMLDRAKESKDGYFVGGEYDRISFSPRNWFVKNYTTTEKNQNCPLGTFSMWLTNGATRNYLKARIPLPQDQLAGICIEANQVNPNVYHRNEDWFYMIKSDSSTDNINIEYSENWISSIRSRILGNYADKYNKTIQLSENASFVYNNETYYVLYDDEFFPIISVKLE